LLLLIIVIGLVDV